MEQQLYTCAFARDPEFGGWSAIVLDMPGACTQGETFEEARANASEALALMVQALREEGEGVPPPRALADLLDDPALQDDLDNAVLVQIAAPPPPARAVRVTFTMEENLLRRLDAFAAARGDTRSGLLAEATRAFMSAG